ncbi:OmpA family protein [Mucilaginibacter sp. UR6-11]|uniref:OmpA family protein n=1 Tax=Mucilaginibacter sp. UR6-11 TaxID=1435644 RepID=UPI001E3BE124|nr:OmpA family protein [Mucilaginibacter sp. UR6-11]MCC8424677.1 OmpA family protein [Mucilaginibacter sp. UR6-11]
MAQLDVQPKKSAPWWIWLLLAIFAILVLLLLLKGCNGKTTQVVTDSTSSKETIAVTQPDWNNVDFNAPATTDPDVTDKDIAVTGTDKYTIYTLGENILFGSDKNTLQGSAGAKLKQIAASLNKRFNGAPIAIYGNTDSTGTGQHNADLGGWRAVAVKNWLVANGLDSTKVSLHTFGESKPVASNATASGRQQNRNVQIVAFPDHK